MAAAVGGLVWVGFESMAQLERAIAAMSGFRLPWLLAAGLCQLAGLALAGEALWRLQGRPAIVGRPVAQGATLVNIGLGAILPASPVEGFTWSFLELRRRGLPSRRAGLALAWGQWLQARAFVLVAAVSALAVVGFGEATGHLADLMLLGVAAGGVFLVGTWLLIRWPGPSAAVVVAGSRLLPSRLRPHEPRELAERLHAEAQALIGRGFQRLVSVLLASLAVLANCTCLWLVLVAGRHTLSLEEVLLAGAVATLASWVPLLPGGIGVAESTVTAVLHYFGIPVPIALAAAVLWRVTSMVMPAVSGLLALVALRVRRGMPSAARPQRSEPSD